MYSETAAQNYPDPELFNKLQKALPAKRCGTTAEVKLSLVLLLVIIYDVGEPERRRMFAVNVSPLI